MLPKIDVPTYEIEIPSNKEVIKVRPFTVKEEKLLLMAMESNDADEIVKTVKQVINNCIIGGNFNIDKLPFFDVDFLFIFLRAKSIGESVEVNLTCNNTLEDGNTCGNVFPAMMDIAKCEIVRPEGVNEDIKLNEKQGVKMRYPNYAAMKRVELGNEIDEKTNTIVNAIDYIYDAKGMYSWKDYSKDELKEFVEGLTEENYNKMMAFVDNFPTFVVKMEATCNKCGFHHTVRYSDFYDFFM
jgi:ribosomal protein L6P/L9E